MNRGFGSPRGSNDGPSKKPAFGARPFDKFRRDGRVERDQPVPDQRFGGPGKPGFPKRDDYDESRSGSRGFGSRDRDHSGSARDASGRFARRDDNAPPARPFFPKSAPRRDDAAPFRGSSARSEGGYGRPRNDQQSFRDERPFRNNDRDAQASRPQRSYGDAPAPRSQRSYGDAPAPRSQRSYDDAPAPRARRSFDAPPPPRVPRAETPLAPRGEAPVRVPRVTNSVEETDSCEVVCGIHAVEALLESTPRRVQRLLLLRGSADTRLHKLQAQAEALRIPCQQIEGKFLDLKTPGKKSQGVVALCNAREYADWTELHASLKADIAAGKAPIVLVASAIEDPRNLGAIARTCAGLDVSALIIPMKGGCGLTALADETSAGALAQLPVTRPNDLEKTLKELSADGFKIIGLDVEGDDIRSVDFSGPIVVVAGGEDRGIPPHMRRPCDRVASIPMSNRLQSYNASVAAAVVLWEIRRGR